MKPKHFVLIFILMASTVCAQSGAFISKEKLFTQLKGYTAKQSALDTLRLQLSKDLQKQQQELQKRYQDLTKSYQVKQGETLELLTGRMSKIDAEKLRLLQEEQKLQDTRVKSYSAQLDAQYAKDLKPYLDQVESALQQYAQKNKIDMIWYLEDVSKALPYYNKSKDITAAIAEMVNKGLQ